jgi:hypothetical protein
MRLKRGLPHSIGMLLVAAALCIVGAVIAFLMLRA